MALTNNYVQVYGKFPELFRALSEGQAPEHFTRQHLKDVGFGGSNFRAVIPLLKTLGFLSENGEPTQRYHAYRDSSRSRRIMGEALKEAYADLFVIRAHPTDQDRALIEGKFKSAHNTNERLARLMANTFFALLNLADLPDSQREQPESSAGKEEKPPAAETTPLASVVAAQAPVRSAVPPLAATPSFHYNIQIHLPATKDVEVFNAIFKSLKEHFLG